MSVTVTVGTARVDLDSTDWFNGVGAVAQEYDFDALLHAVSRAAAAVLSDGDYQDVQGTVSGLRLRLRERTKNRSEATT